MKSAEMKTVAAYASISDPGKSSLNEDAYIVVPKRQLFGVADGFGGNGIGDKTSKQVLEHVSFFVENGLGDSEVTLPFVYRSYYTSGANLIFNAFLYANRQIFEENKGRHINARGGTSAMFVFFEGRHMTLANVGSCSAFLVRGETVQELVKPRSYNTYRSTGTWKPHWSFPLMALGTASDLEPEILELHVEKGDVIVLATDGVYPHLKKEDLAALGKIVGIEGTEEAIYKENHRLIDICRSAGDSDNKSMISIVCA